MAATRIYLPPLRLRWPELDRLTWALVISLLIHGAFYGAYQGNKKFHWLDKIHLPAWMQKVQEKLTVLQPKKNPQQQNQSDPMLVFVEVDPTVATAEPPKDAKYYSSKNSKAANPDADSESNVPKITGTQEQIAKTEDVPRSKASPLQPSVPQNKQEQQEEKQKRSQTPGDLAMAKPDSVQHKDDGQAAKSRPRTLIEAAARQQQANPLAGQKMKQEGGVKRNNIVPSFGAKKTPWGDYDNMIIAAVQNRWYQLLDERNFAGASGKVTLEFRLHYDGSISDMKVSEKTVDEILSLLCQKAVLDPAKYEKWPMEMRRLIGADYREIKFTFFYN